MIATDALVKKVRSLVNEAESDADVTLITDDRRSLDDTIIELLPQAVALIQSNANGAYVNVKAIPADARVIERASDGVPFVTLPGCFVKLVSLQLASWKVPCRYISSPESAETINALNFNGGAGVFSPVCVDGVTEEGVKIVKLFPCDSTDALLHLVYEASFDPDEGLVMCDMGMADAVAYACASLLYSVFEKHDAAKSFISLAMALCGGNENVKR